MLFFFYPVSLLFPQNVNFKSLIHVFCDSKNSRSKLSVWAVTHRAWSSWWELTAFVHKCMSGVHPAKYLSIQINVTSNSRLWTRTLLSVKYIFMWWGNDLNILRGKKRRYCTQTSQGDQDQRKWHLILHILFPNFPEPSAAGSTHIQISRTSHMLKDRHVHNGFLSLRPSFKFLLNLRSL